MSECREKSIIEELGSLDLEQADRDRIIKKYWNEVERHRSDIAMIREEAHREATELKRANVEKSTIISVLSAYIKEKELL